MLSLDLSVSGNMCAVKKGNALFGFCERKHVLPHLWILDVGSLDAGSLDHVKGNMCAALQQCSGRPLWEKWNCSETLSCHDTKSNCAFLFIWSIRRRQRYLERKCTFRSCIFWQPCLPILFKVISAQSLNGCLCTTVTFNQEGLSYLHLFSFNRLRMKLKLLSTQEGLSLMHLFSFNRLRMSWNYHSENTDDPTVVRNVNSW